MLKFSASYVGTNPNFVIQNIKKNKVEHTAIFAILSNILQRGCPTIPTRYLREEFGEYQDVEYRYLYNYDNCNWDNVIKGGGLSNPALDFYNNTLTKILGQFAKTFIAECPLRDIIEEYEGMENITDQVDFYSPLFNAVIEIDGMQHYSKSDQIIKDDNRDEVLKTNGIQIIRISTQELLNLEIVKKKLSVLKKNTDYSDGVELGGTIDDVEKSYMISSRMEMLLLNLYKNGYISLGDKTINLNIHCTEDVNKKVFEIAVNNYLLWLKNISGLQNIDINIPVVNINLVNSEDELAGLEKDVQNKLDSYTNKADISCDKKVAEIMEV